MTCVQCFFFSYVARRIYLSIYLRPYLSICVVLSAFSIYLSISYVSIFVHVEEYQTTLIQQVRLPRSFGVTL